MYQGQTSVPGRALSGLLFPAQCEHTVLSITLLQTPKSLEIFKGEKFRKPPWIFCKCLKPVLVHLSSVKYLYAEGMQSRE